VVGVGNGGYRCTDAPAQSQPPHAVHCPMLASCISFDSILNALSRHSFGYVNFALRWRAGALARVSCISVGKTLFATLGRARYLTAANKSHIMLKPLLLGVERYASCMERWSVCELVLCSASWQLATAVHHVCTRTTEKHRLGLGEIIERIICICNGWGKVAGIIYGLRCCTPGTPPQI
jgi:hypothetical protein